MIDMGQPLFIIAKEWRKYTMRHNYKRISALAGMAVLLVTTPASVYAGQIRGDNAVNQNIIIRGSDITIDADLDDWESVSERASDVSGVTAWRVAVSSDYSKMYFSYNGITSSEWDYSYFKNNIAITYSDGTSDAASQIQFTGWKDSAQAKNAWYADIADSVTVTNNQAQGSVAGEYVVEASIPFSFFSNGDFKITFAGTTVDVSDIEVLDGNAVEKDEDENPEEPSYNGIIIDGNYSDWNPVNKYDVVSTYDSYNKSYISQAAMVFDGDYVYLYVKDGPDGSAAGAGTHSNGKFSIVTDLGYELVFQLDQRGVVNGVEGADCRHFDRQWEISIPKSMLPAYNKTISFGLYEAEPIVKDVANLQEDGPSEEIIYNLKYDGLYGDWDMYPHTRIGYSTAGTQHNKVDAMGALFSDGSTVLGHVYTRMPEHLNEAGGEFTQAVTFRFNESDSQEIYPRFVAVDDKGNINWNPVTRGLQDGSYEFYMFNSDAWGTSDNINNLNSADVCLGKMTITVGENKDECEYYLDLDMVAKKLGCDASDLKQISAQFGRIGQQWINIAGASSGAWLGLFICITATCGVVAYKKKKGNKQVVKE